MLELFHFCSNKVKLIDVFNLFIGKYALALKSLICLSEKHSSFPKTHSSKLRFFSQWATLDEPKQKAAFSDEKIFSVSVQELKTLGFGSDLNSLNEKFLKDNSKDLASVYEFIKMRQELF